MKKKDKMDLKIFTNKITLMLIGILSFSVIGATYAYYAFGASNNHSISGNMAKVDLALKVNRIFPNNFGYMVPQSSNTKALSSALNNQCIDQNDNIVCQVYSINIKNDGGTATEVVDGKASFYSDNALTKNSYEVMPNLRWKIIDRDSNNNFSIKDNPDNIATSTPLNFVSDLSLTSNKEYTFYMVIWFDETGTDQIDQGNTFYGQIEFNSSNGTGVTATF